jgi:hypothetical protein
MEGGAPPGTRTPNPLIESPLGPIQTVPSPLSPDGSLCRSGRICLSSGVGPYQPVPGHPFPPPSHTWPNGTALAESGGLRDAAAGAFDGAVDAALSVASPTASHDPGLRWARKKEHKVLHVDSNSNAYQDAYFLAIAAPAFLVPGGEAEVVAEDSLSALQTEIHEAQAAARAERAAQEAEQAAKAERVTPKEGPARPTMEEPS